MKLLSGSQDHKSNGVATVGASSAIPITKIANTSSVNTTFTTKTVTDSSAWTLTNIVIGDTAVTSDGFRGTVLSTATRIINVNRWVHDSGYEGTPANGSTVTAHRLNCVRRLLLNALADNAQLIYVGLNGDATVADYAMAKGNTITICPDGDDEIIDVTKVCAISESGTQYLGYMQGGQT